MGLLISTHSCSEHLMQKSLSWSGSQIFMSISFCITLKQIPATKGHKSNQLTAIFNAAVLINLAQHISCLGFDPALIANRTKNVIKAYFSSHLAHHTVIPLQQSYGISCSLYNTDTETLFTAHRVLEVCKLLLLILLMLFWRQFTKRF